MALWFEKILVLNAIFFQIFNGYQIIFVTVLRTLGLQNFAA
jgi:hypothetical protein